MRIKETTARQEQPFADPLWERAMRAKNRGHGALATGTAPMAAPATLPPKSTNLGCKIMNGF